MALEKRLNREAPKSLLVSFLFTVRRLLRIATFVLILVLLLPKVFLLFDNPKNASFSATLLEARDVVLKKSAPLLHHYIPTDIAGADHSDWILIGLLAIDVVGSAAMKAGEDLPIFILRRLAVMFVDIRPREIDELADMLLAQDIQVADVLNGCGVGRHAGACPYLRAASAVLRGPPPVDRQAPDPG